MRVLVIGMPKFPIPPDELGGIIEGAISWHDRYAEHLEVFGTFPGGGGFGVVDVPDEKALNQMIAEMPFAFVSDIQVRVFVDGVAGLRQLQEAVAGMNAAR